MFIDVIMPRYSGLEISSLASNVLLWHEGEQGKRAEETTTDPRK
jgi:hypothetical protein